MSTTTTTKNGKGAVAVYCRISDDRSGHGENIQNQESWGTEYAAAAWPDLPVKVYSDNDISASKRGAVLPERERMLADVVAGEIAHVWTVEQSRLTRRESEWFPLADAFEEAGIAELHTRRDGAFPLRDIKASIQAVLAGEETRKLSKRVRDDMAEHAASGGIPGGSVFGYRRVTVDGVKRLEVIPEQAAIIREAAQRILAGETQTAIANDFHARGIRGTKGGRIWQSTIHGMVTNHTVAGLRLHDAGSTGQGKVYEGSWEPILDRPTWERVRDRLGESRVGRWKSGRPVRFKYATLCSGIIRCDACPKGGAEYSMVASRRRERRAGGRRADVVYYSCRLCGRGIQAAPVDQYVAQRLLDRLEPLVDLRTPADHRRSEEIDGELRTIERQRQEWGRALADGTLDLTGYTAANERASEREAALIAEQRELPRPDEALSADAAHLAWDGGTLQERRELLARFIDEVTIAPARGHQRNRGVDLGRVSIRGQGWEDGGRLAEAGRILRAGYDRWTRAMHRFEHERRPDMSVREELDVIEAAIRAELGTR
jgi:site-specific DNA recombinase